MLPYSIGVAPNCCHALLNHIFHANRQHSIMAHFYPWREKERAVWLYNVILRQRGGIARWLRRNLRRRKILGKHAKMSELPVAVG